MAAFVGASSVLAQKCSAGNQCPEKAPCCSQYGECGVGAYCLGGCDPRHSFSMDSCVPAPTCKDVDFKFDTKDGIVSINDYLGDADKASWVRSGETALYNDYTLLTMPKGSTGTVLSSTSYMWYGNVKARMKTARGRGVISGFILFSDIQDEIDYEWIGVDLETAQTNFYFQGVTDYTNSENISLSDTFHNWHDYEIRWTPDKIEWLVDGQVGRTKERKDTWNETSQNWQFPQTPARVQLSIWPGGLESNPKGTIEWAGGLIDWNAEDIQNTGYFWASVESVSIECYDGKDGIGTNNGKSYWYDDDRYTNDTVVDGDKKHILATLQGTGTDLDKGKKDDEDDGKDDDDNDDDDSDDPAETTVAAQIPGGGNGAPGNDHHGGDDEGASDDGGSGDGNTVNTPDSNNPCSDVSKFCTGDDEGSSGNDDSSGTKSRASMLAIVIAGAALFWL